MQAEVMGIARQMGAKTVGRVALHIADALVVCALALLALMGTAQPAYAYVDPSVMTYTIQALAGVAVALSTLLGVVYRRVRKKVVTALGIDENAGKVVDPDVHAVDSAQKLSDANHKAARFWRNVPDPLAPRKLKWPSRLWRAVLISLALVLLVIIVPPFELMMSNTDSLTYGLKDIWKPLVQLAVIVFLVVAAVLTALPSKVFDIVYALACALAILLWLQPMFLNGTLPSADGATIDWGSYLGAGVFDTIVWVAIIAGGVVAALLYTKRFRQCMVFACAALLIMQGAALTSLFVGDDSKNLSGQGADGSATSYTMTSKGLLDVAPSNNVIVLVLDMFDTSDMQTYLASHPDASSDLTGFTWYTDSAGSLIPTRFGIPYLLTGTYPTDGQTYTSYIESRYTSSTFIDSIYNQNYDLGIYTDTMTYVDTYFSKCKYILNMIPDDAVEYSVNESGGVNMLLQTSFYRNLPWSLKSLFWYQTDDVNQSMVVQTAVTDDSTGYEAQPYVMDDDYFHTLLDTKKLSVVDRGSTGAFRFIHLDGAHYPYTLDATGHRTTTEVSREDQVTGTMAIVRDYISQLKALGVYDSSTIIITADHGLWECCEEGSVDTCTYASSPIFLVKPAASTGSISAGRSLVEDDATPTGHVDYPATVLKACGADYSAYGTAVDEVPAGVQRDRIYYFLRHYPAQGTDVDLQKYVIHGNALDFSTWENTGVTIPNTDKKYHE